MRSIVRKTTLVAPHPWALLTTKCVQAQQDHLMGKPHYYEAENLYFKSQACTDQSTFLLRSVSTAGQVKEFTGYGE